MNPRAKTADACRQLLHAQQISADGPGAILRDVEIVLDFIGERGLVTKSQQGNLPSAVLPELNTRLSSPIETYLKRPLLRDYPNIAGIYILLRVMDLARVEGRRLWIDAETLGVWRGLNPVEKYFALLEAWLFHADAEVLGSGDRPHRRQFVDNLTFLADFRKSRWKSFYEYCHLSTFDGAVSAWNAQLQARFGLVEVEPRSLRDRTGEGCGWIMKSARRTAWGEAVAWAILESVVTEERSELWLLDAPEDADFGTLQPAFRPYFPEWKKVFGLTRAIRQTGIHLFKVSFADYRVSGEVWCRLAVPANASLDELSFSILKVFKFSDTEHLYEFRYRDRLGKGRVYHHPSCEDGPYASEIAVGDTDLPEKAIMKFMFDYGDSWRFELRLEGIGSPTRKNASIKIIEAKGRPPKQYPDWE